MYNPKPGDRLESLDTPIMVVDLDMMEENIRKLMLLLKPLGVNIRPHLKTTKSPILAKRLIAAGAIGGCVAKVSEAEILAAEGVDDILITCEIIGAVKIGRLVELFRKHPKIQIVVDSEFGATAIDTALRDSGIKKPIQVLIDLDVGLHRTGVDDAESALALAQHISTLDHLKLIGVQGYEGHLQHLHGREEREKQCRDSMEILTSTATLLREKGFDIQVVTTGGTGTAEFCATTPGVTEVQPGSFIFMDSDYRNAVGNYFSNSLTIISTVISKSASARRVTIDAGLKTLTTDSGFAEAKNMPGVTYTAMGDEHGWLEWEENGPAIPIGARVEMIPSHIDPTINLHDFYYAHRKGVIEEIWPVATRGKVQ